MDSDHSLLMEPNEILKFSRALNTSDTSQIHLKNISSSNLIFKLRTNSPDTYLVRPTQGILGPNEEKTVTVIFQGKDSQLDTKKDKFLIIHSTTSLPILASSQEISEFFRTSQPSSLKSAKLSVSIESSQSNLLSSTTPRPKPSILSSIPDPNPIPELFSSPHSQIPSVRNFDTILKKVKPSSQPNLGLLTLVSIMGLALGVFYLLPI
jgi:hypothetical protein